MFIPFVLPVLSVSDVGGALLLVKEWFYKLEPVIHMSKILMLKDVDKETAQVLDWFDVIDHLMYFLIFPFLTIRVGWTTLFLNFLLMICNIREL